MGNTDWYTINEAECIASPALVFYEDRIQRNIDLLLEMIGDTSRLRPHVKTHKSADLSKLMIAKGITSFKCATIAEAEMLGHCGASDVLLAYQPVGPNGIRFLELMQKFPETKFSCLVDDFIVAQILSTAASQREISVDVYIDLNVGMNRTGISIARASDLAAQLLKLPALKLLGLHAYDGHIHDTSIELRRRKVADILSEIFPLKDKIASFYSGSLTIVAGGTPTFPIYAEREDVVCSPGTFALWDKGYRDAFEEQQFLPAALLLCRVVSVPAPGLICVDLGHKAVAAENVLQKRVVFLNAPDLEPVSQSEEHLVLKVSDGVKYQIGDVLYGLPFHICPTVALHETAQLISEGKLKSLWPITSRKRKITI